jgi:hypothetical protein
MNTGGISDFSQRQLAHEYWGGITISTAINMEGGQDHYVHVHSVTLHTSSVPGYSMLCNVFQKAVYSWSPC